MRTKSKYTGLILLQLILIVTLLFTASTLRTEAQDKAADKQSSTKQTENSQTTPTQTAPARTPQTQSGASPLNSVSNAAGKDETATFQPAPVLINGNQLFSIEASLGPVTAAARARQITHIIKRLQSDQEMRVGLVETADRGNYTDIDCGDIHIMTVTEGDANMAGVTRAALAQRYAERIKKFLIESKMESKAPSALGLSLKNAGIATAVLLVLLILISAASKQLGKTLASWKGKFIKAIRIQDAELLAEDTIYSILYGSLKLLRTVILLSIVFVYAVTVLSFFPQTEQIAFSLKDQVLYAIFQLAGPAIVSYLPNLFFMLLIIVVTRYLLKFIKFVANELERETLKLPGFEKEWVAPTCNIVRFLVLVFAAMLIFPYLPGSGSPAFQQITIFLGVLLSLGSTGAVAHIIAGVFLTYTGAFRLNDRVQIADTVGDVVGKSLLATRVRTIKHEYITVPNGLVLGSHIVNYSASRSDPGLILHSTVTLGYDLDWRIAHELLIGAANATKHIVSKPAPFVLQTSLNDHHVAYQINAYTDAPSSMALVYSELHQNILDKFRDAGVEILSPEYRAIRDGNKPAIPEIK